MLGPRLTSLFSEALDSSRTLDKWQHEVKGCHPVLTDGPHRASCAVTVALGMVPSSESALRGSGWSLP